MDQSSNHTIHLLAGLRRYGCFVVLIPALFLLSTYALAQPSAKKYLMVTGQPETPAYAISVGISSLVKVQLMPSKGLDLDTTPTSGLLESFSKLQSNEAQFALLGAVWKDIGVIDDNIQSVATLWRDGERSIQLLARRDVEPDATYEITRAIFENLAFLRNIEGRLDSASLDHALDAMVLPLHQGARRYFEQVQVLQPQPRELSTEIAATDSSLSHSIRGKTFVIYFDFDDATITEEAAAVLDEVAALTEKDLDNATVWMAGYTDTYGERLYNQQLGERRVNAVREGLRARGFVPPELFSSAFGERMTWINTDDQTLEARNRRVEIFIEYHGTDAPNSPFITGDVTSNTPQVANEPTTPIVPAKQPSLVPSLEIDQPVINNEPKVEAEETSLPSPASAETRRLSPIF